MSAVLLAALVPAAIPSPPLDWRWFDIGPLRIHLYALIMIAGIIVAVLWTNRRLTARGGEPWIVLDFMIWGVVLGIVGARAYHVLTHPDDYFAGQPWTEVFAIWNGGNAIMGGLIGGGIGTYIASRIAGVRFLSFADAVAPAMLVAQAIGRLGNYVNHELFGGPTDLPWGLEIEATNPAFPVGLEPGTLFHPTFLYELLWNLVGAGLLVVLERAFRLRWGKTAALYFVWYGVGRAWIESIRVDPSEVILGMRSNEAAAWVLALVGVVLFVVQTIRHREPERSI